jgi:hypothetical protein
LAVFSYDPSELIGVQLRLWESQPQPLQRDPTSLSNDEMVEQLNCERSVAVSPTLAAY